MRLIDADELQKALAKKWYEAPERLSGIKVSMLIDDQPTIETTPVRYRRWIKMSDADGIFYACSECGEWHKEMSNYCPNCGAKMEYVRRWRERYIQFKNR